MAETGQDPSQEQTSQFFGAVTPNAIFNKLKTLVQSGRGKSLRHLLILVALLLAVEAGSSYTKIKVPVGSFDYILKNLFAQKEFIRFIAFCLALIASVLGYFRPRVFLRVFAFLKKLFVSKVQPLVIRSLQKIVNWLRNFKESSFKDRLRMAIKPAAAVTVVYLILSYGKLFLPPKIVVTFPGNEGESIPLDSNFEVQFDRKMHRASVERNFAINPEVAGRFEWLGDTRVTFTPDKPFEIARKYEVEVGSMAMSAFFIPKFFPQKIAFETLGHPKVILASPQIEAPEVGSPITVMFDRAMIPLTSADEKESQLPAFTLSPEVEGEGGWLGTTAYQFRPAKPLKLATTYTYTVPAGMKAKDNGELHEDFGFSFSTVRPRVLGTSPSDNYNYASPTASVSATLNMPIRLDSARESFHLFRLEGEVRNEVPVSIRINKLYVGMYPVKALEREVWYEARIDAGLLAIEGENGLEHPYTWKFKTAPLPKIIATNPGDGSKEVEQEHRIEVSFVSPMDEKSFKDNVIIAPQPDRKPSTYFSSYSGKHSLSIDTYLGRSSDYTITIKGNVEDQHDVPLGQDYTFSFRTAAYKPSITIIPSGTYFASFNQEIVPRIVAKVVNVNDVTYKLYKLKRNDFLAIYKIHISGPWEQRNLQSYDPSKHELVREWKEEFETDQNIPVHVITKVEKGNGEKIDPGFYFLDARIGNGNHDNLVMVVSKSSLTLKTSPSQALVWAVNSSTGEVVKDMDIEIVRLGSSLGKSGKTNTDGVFKVDGEFRSERGGYVSYENPIIAFAKGGGDEAVVIDAWQKGIQPYEFGLPSYYDYQERDDYRASENLKVYIVLDRPIYRPGQKVYYKGVVRRDKDGIYELLDQGSQVQVSVQDARGKEVFRDESPLSSFGTFSGFFDLSGEGSVGFYTINATVLGNGFSQQFQVEEYRKPDFSVEVSADKPDYTDKEVVDASVTAAFFFGSPVDHAPIKWTLTTSDSSFRWQKDLRFEFGDNDSYWYRPWWFYRSYNYYSGEKVAEGTGTTDKDGNYSLKLPLNISDKETNQTMRLEAIVTDVSNQAIANSKEFVIHQAGLHVGVKPERYSGKAGQESRVELVAVTIDGQTLKDIPVKVSFYKRTWDYVREQDPDTEEFYWTNKATDTFISAVEVVTGELGRATASFVPPEGGSFRVVAEASDSQGRMTKSAAQLWISGFGVNSPQENHDRIVIVPDKDEYAIGDTAQVIASLPYENMTGLVTIERGSVYDYKIVKLTSDNQAFDLSITERYSPNAFISASFIKAGKEVKDPPHFKMGVAEIRVDNPKTEVNLELSTPKERFSPGEEMEVNLTTKDGTGANVKTEVAVALVDEAVWSLARAELADIYQTFYNPRNLSVLTANDLTVSMDRLNENVNLGAKGGSGGGCFTGETPILMSTGTYKAIQDVAAGDSVLTREGENSQTMVSARVSEVFVHDVSEYFLLNGKLKVTGVHRLFTKKGWLAVNAITPEDELLDANGLWVKVESIKKIIEPVRVYNLKVENYHTFIAGNIWVHNQKDGGPETVREKFLDTAYWNAHVETDDNGQGHFKVKLPDNLTTWRLIGIAVSKNTSVGDSVKKILVTKDVLIQPLLPRFISVGDKPKLGMVVHNNTGSSSTVSTEISLTGLSVVGTSKKTTTIAADTSQKIYWDTEVKNIKEAEVVLRAEGGGFSDSVKIKIPVISYYTPEVVATSGEAKDVGDEKVFLPANIVPDQGSLEVSLSPTLGSGVQDAASYLLSFPYYCNEQIINRVIPAIQLLALAKESGMEKIGGYDKYVLENIVTDGIQRLTNLQRPDGGWGWWASYDANPYLTAMIIDGLLDAQENDFTVPESTIESGMTYLKREMDKQELGLENIVYLASVYSRGKTLDSGILSNLMDRRWQMDELGKAYLLRTLQRGGGSRRDVTRLMDELVAMTVKTNTTAHWEIAKRKWHAMSGNITLTSVMMEALVDNNPKHPFVPDITRWLMQARYDGHWQTTKETSSAVRAIVTMLKERREGKPKEFWKISLAGLTQKEGAFEENDLMKQVVEQFSLAEIAKERNVPVKIEKSGKGALYYNMNLKYFLPFEEVEPLDQGLVVIRDFVDRNGRVIRNSKLNAGDELWIRLIILTAATTHHVIIEDKLPAGIEAVNESLATTSLLNVEKLSIPKDRSPLYFRHHEVRDDRVVLFAETLPTGVYEYTYRVRPTTPGRYHHPPAQAYNMYIPDISGHSSGGWMEVSD